MTSYQLTFILLLVSGITISGYHRRRAGYARDKDVTPKDEGTLILGARIVGGGALLLGMVGYAITPGWFS